MKVIFIQDVSGVARRDEVKEMSNGYALNYLLPRGLAVNATPANLAALTQKSQAHERQDAKQLAQAQAYLSRFKNKIVTIGAKAASSGTLYAALTAEQIADAIQNTTKVPITSAQLIISEHLKTVGDHKVTVRLHSTISAVVTIQIKAT
jgi:large subunit ribosomal protein L9